ncbi:MAG: restriction endonuclease [Burkholderiaceae bacterium]|nr:restriction endonuclease [Burkholderiaceae bacterium]
MNAQKPEWQQLELLVASIQKQLAPHAKVTHNAKVPGLLSETTRQIDVLVEQNIGQYPMRVALDCKDYGSPVDVKGVEEFHGLVQDIGAHKGALVCPSGFTKSAKKRAKKLHIDLYSPADTGSHKWQVRLALPVVCDFRATRIGFEISCSAPVPFSLPQRFFELPVFSEDGQPLGVIYDIATQRWNEGTYPSDPGVHEQVPLIPDIVTKIDNSYGMLIPVALTVSLHVTRQRYYGHVPIEQLSGLRDEQTGFVITNAFTLGALDPVAVQNHWQKLGESEAPPLQPVLSVRGLHSWGPMNA